MQYETFHTIHRLMKESGVMEDVGGFWNTLSVLYFPLDRFMRCPMFRPVQGGTLREDLVVSYFHGPRDKISVFIMEIERREFEGRPTEWNDALVHLTGYSLEIREKQEKRHAHRMLYAAMAIGRHVRFYQLRPGASTLEDLPGTNQSESPYEIKDNENEIHEILSGLGANCAQ